MTAAENPRAVIGANNPPPDEPPAPTPFEIAKKAVEDAHDEAILWLDGAEVTSQAIADGLGNLLKVIRDARKLADEHRKTENKPFDEGKAEVQRRYKPLLEKADHAAEACKRALQPWLDAEDRRIHEEARKAREEADRIHREAQEAIRAADHTNLQEREAAEALIRDAKKADKIAHLADRKTATAGGAMGRAASLRTVHVAVITDRRAFGRWASVEHREEMNAFLQTLADRLVREGKRDLPGVEIHDERKAV